MRRFLIVILVALAASWAARSQAGGQVPAPQVRRPDGPGQHRRIFVEQELLALPQRLVGGVGTLHLYELCPGAAPGIRRRCR